MVTKLTISPAGNSHVCGWPLTLSQRTILPLPGAGVVGGGGAGVVGGSVVAGGPGRRGFPMSGITPSNSRFTILANTPPVSVKRMQAND